MVESISLPEKSDKPTTPGGFGAAALLSNFGMLYLDFVIVFRMQRFFGRIRELHCLVNTCSSERPYLSGECDSFCFRCSTVDCYMNSWNLQWVAQRQIHGIACLAPRPNPDGKRTENRRPKYIRLEYLAVRKNMLCCDISCRYCSIFKSILGLRRRCALYYISINSPVCRL
jgi:hypothetical protein